MKIQYLPTGNIFDLPEADCLKIYLEDRCNYKFLDKIKLPEVAQTKIVSVDDLVVKDDTNDLQKKEKTEVKTESVNKTDTDTQKAELIKKAKSLGIKGNLENSKVETLKKKIAALEK